MTQNELENFYHITGKAIWHLQYVEESLGFLYLYKVVFSKFESISADVAHNELLKVQKKTLGQLVVAAEKHTLIGSVILERLKKFNAERKWMVHKSLIEDGDNLYNHVGRNGVFDRIIAFTEESIALQKIVGEEIFSYCDSIGFSREWQEAHGKNELLKLKGLA